MPEACGRQLARQTRSCASRSCTARGLRRRSAPWSGPCSTFCGARGGRSYTTAGCGHGGHAGGRRSRRIGDEGRLTADVCPATGGRGLGTRGGARRGGAHVRGAIGHRLRPEPWRDREESRRLGARARCGPLRRPPESENNSWTLVHLDELGACTSDCWKEKHRVEHCSWRRVTVPVERGRSPSRRAGQGVRMAGSRPGRCTRRWRS